MTVPTWFGHVLWRGATAGTCVTACTIERVEGGAGAATWKPTSSRKVMDPESDATLETKAGFASCATASSSSLAAMSPT